MLKSDPIIHHHQQFKLYVQLHFQQRLLKKKKKKMNIDIKLNKF